MDLRKFQQLDFPIKKKYVPSKNAVGRTCTKQSQYLNTLIHNMFIYLICYTRYILGGFTIEPSFLFKGRYIRCVYIYIYLFIYINVAAQTSTFSSWFPFFLGRLHIFSLFFWLFGCLPPRVMVSFTVGPNSDSTNTLAQSEAADEATSNNQSNNQSINQPTNQSINQ